MAAPSEWWALTASAVVLAVALWHFLCRVKSRRGYGSGENNSWNRRIRMERPVHVSKHHRLEHVWEYTGPSPAPAAALPGSGPVTGHLIGRQTWSPVPAAGSVGGSARAASMAAAAAAAQEAASFDPSERTSAGDKLLRAQLLRASGGNPSDATPPPPRGAAAAMTVSPMQALNDGWDFYSKLLSPDGFWPGDYGGPLFLMPGLIIACWVAGVSLGPRASAMLTYTRNHQQADGGWGLHIEGPSTLFGSIMNYVAARLLGVKENDKVRAALL